MATEDSTSNGRRGITRRKLLEGAAGTDLWRDAAQALGVPADQIPSSNSRGKETFFNRKVFDPENPAAYFKSLAIKRAELA